MPLVFSAARCSWHTRIWTARSTPRAGTQSLVRAPAIRPRFVRYARLLLGEPPRSVHALDATAARSAPWQTRLRAARAQLCAMPAGRAVRARRTTLTRVAGPEPAHDPYPHPNDEAKKHPGAGPHPPFTNATRPPPETAAGTLCPSASQQHTPLLQLHHQQLPPVVIHSSRQPSAH